jgi:hypothetical protein
MTTVVAVAGEGLNKNVVKISSTGEAALARNEVSRLLHGRSVPMAPCRSHF